MKRAKRAADKAGIELSEWEGEFLQSVAERVKTYGRAFADPDKGAPGTPLSMMQGAKLREISAKAAGKDKRSGRPGADRAKDGYKPRFGQRRRPSPARPDDAED